jgi:hypothetical protein
VIDGDFGPKVKEARAVAGQSDGIKLAVSTMCFEYWILLHGKEIGMPTASCDETFKILKKEYLPNYSKGDFSFDELVRSYREASQQAKKLRMTGIRRRSLAEDQNPCSEVYLLIEEVCGDIRET